jgi:hypothetical protein
MSPARRRVILCAAAVALLSACQSAPPAPKVEQANFAAFPPIVLDVARVDVTDNSRRPPGSVDAHIPVPPAEGVKQWARARLQAAGRDGSVRVIIKEASIVESSLAKTGGVKGVFTNDQTLRYDARVAVEITAEKASADGLRAATQASATRFITLPENTSLAGREAALQNLSARLLDDLNARLDAGVRKDFSRLARR